VAAVTILAVWLSVGAAGAAPPIRILGGFGATVYAAKPTVAFPAGGPWTIPANYAVSFSAQYLELTGGLFAWGGVDRFWSGSGEQFTNSALVVSGGFGWSIPVGYARLELLGGLCRYDETFEIWTRGGGAAKVELAATDVVAGVQFVFLVTDGWRAAAGYRAILRDGRDLAGTLDSGLPYVLSTNSADVVLTFGFGYEFGR